MPRHRALNGGQGKKSPTDTPTVTADDAAAAAAATAAKQEEDYEEYSEQAAENNHAEEEEDVVEPEDFYMQYNDFVNATETAFAECNARQTSLVSVLHDDWTRAGEKPPNCTFPFAFQGKIYFTCTNAGGYNQYWCANSCHFADGHSMLFRGVCDVPQNHAGVLGTGIGLTFLNVFLVFMLTVALLAFFLLCVVECCSRWMKRRNAAAVGVDELETQKMTAA